MTRLFETSRVSRTRYQAVNRDEAGTEVRRDCGAKLVRRGRRQDLADVVIVVLGQRNLVQIIAVRRAACGLPGLLAVKAQSTRR
jgi:hypothetical protein